MNAPGKKGKEPGEQRVAIVFRRRKGPQIAGDGKLDSGRMTIAGRSLESTCRGKKKKRGRERFPASKKKKKKDEYLKGEKGGLNTSLYSKEEEAEHRKKKGENKGKRRGSLLILCGAPKETQGRNDPSWREHLLERREVKKYEELLYLLHRKEKGRLPIHFNFRKVKSNLQEKREETC